MTLLTKLAEFCKGRSGNIGVMAATMIPALVGLIGASIDYTRAEQIRQKMQHAADLAVLAASNNQLLGRGTPEEQVQPFLDANLKGVDGFNLVKVFVEQDGDGYARVRVSAESDNYFLGMFGVDTFSIVAEAVARYQREFDLEIGIYLDNSPSMLIGATQADITGLESKFGCAFTCHYPDNGDHAYDMARALGYDTPDEGAHALGYKTRLIAAKEAINRAFTIAHDSEFSTSAEIYFDVNTFAKKMEDVSRGTAAEMLGSAGDPVRAIGPLPRPSNHIYETTDPEVSFNQATAEAKARQAKYKDRQHFFLILTDGVADYNRGGRKIHQFYSSYCDDLKKHGIRVGVIYTTYFELPSNAFWRSNVKPFTNDIGPQLKACASPGWYFEARYAEDIDNALAQLMSMAIPRPRLAE